MSADGLRFYLKPERARCHHKVVQSRPAFLSPVRKITAFWLLIAALPLAAFAEDLTFEIPPVQTSLNVSGQPVSLTVSGAISQASPGRGGNDQTFSFNLRADLADFQDHLTPLLQAQLNQSERCGERMSVENAVIVPSAPAARLTVGLHFERWACLKAFGKENARRLVGGEGTVEMVLTPAVEQGNTVRLDAEVGSIKADGSLGELLRSGSLGDALREKIRAAILRAVQKATDLGGVLPAQAQPFVSIQTVSFGNDPGGRLALRIAGRLLVPSQQVSSLLAQFRAQNLRR